MTTDTRVNRKTRATSTGSTGLIWGALGVLGFSLTLPMTKVAVSQFSAVFATSARAVIGAVLAALTLLVLRQTLPSRRQWVRLTVISFGVVLGFPLFTTLGLTTTSASHSAVVVGLLPAATAVAASIRGHEHPRPVFWVFTAAGALTVVMFSMMQSASMHLVLEPGDLWLFAAVVAAAVGYAEGGLVSRELGAWQTICWALLLAAPVMGTLALVTGLREIHTLPGPGPWRRWATSAS
ncbi:DMT family transporter [Acidipropionibacterium jensenii]|uniref:EamA-like transporter family n=1 Tax=Acidipropionibacterium jensenii TaxID=1749 RepID=A0A448NVC3_9ACTN|nr:EamA family transporter [Acidipropionibacterium jensenii]MDN5978539.1 DMT family transporter [Acidipropionibacterium jensenii]MDN5996760.1 DMT family transporter [Acidipropionibacterium jensenii]MDN6427316.1 DMT family transporter [Acidipropionibacterium jensenii]MDN6442855.1 DMT family transporter [Acidipropionibacterium jensenii]MDN6479673.1 DMT family transporter [Acidipropionibacterium jensenii]